MPLGATRLGYTDAPGTRAAFTFQPFTAVPLWNHRGQAENGALDGGARVRCVAGRCVRVQFPDGWFPYNKPFAVPLSWQGTLLEEKRDKAGTTYHRNRVYDPATGRFTQEDPIGLAGGLNLYGFAGADPVNLSDPFGLCWRGFSKICEAWNSATSSAKQFVAGAVCGATLDCPSDSSRPSSFSFDYGVAVGAMAFGFTHPFEGVGPAEVPNASDVGSWAEQQGWTRSQTENGPIKYTDENGVVRVTLKQGSARTPGSEGPHMELRNA